MAKAVTASTAAAAGVKTPGSGAFSDPAQVGAMIQKMYSGYYDNVDPTILGQRWIDVHTPAAGSGTGASTGTGLQGPTGTTPLTTTDPNSPDLSGLAQFQSPIKPQPKPVAQKPVVIPQAAGVNQQLTGGNQLTQQPQNNTPWLGSQIVSGIQNFFKAPNLNIQSKPPGY